LALAKQRVFTGVTRTVKLIKNT